MSSASNTSKVHLPKEIKVLVAGAFLIAIGFGIVAPVLPQYARSFEVSVSAAAVIVSVFGLTRLLFAPLSGVLVERMGERRTYIAGILIVAASSAACAVAHDYWQLLLYRGLGGIGSTMFTVAAMGLLIRLSPPQARGRISSVYSGSFLLGSIAGPVVGGLLAGFGLALPFLVYAGALVLVAVLVATQLHEPRNKAEAAGRGSIPAEQALPGSLEGGEFDAVPGPLATAAPPALEQPQARAVLTLGAALAQSAYRAALVSGFANGWSALGIRMALVPLFATAVLGAGPAVAGVSLAVFAGGTALALVFSGQLADSWGRKPMVVLGLVVNGAAMAALGLSGNEAVFFAISAVAGIGSGLMGPAQQATMADVIGTGRSGGRPLAAFQMSQDLGTIVGPIAAGVLVDAFSYEAAFAMAAVVSLLAVVLWIGAKDTRTAA